MQSGSHITISTSSGEELLEMPQSVTVRTVVLPASYYDHYARRFSTCGESVLFWCIRYLFVSFKCRNERKEVNTDWWTLYRRILEIILIISRSDTICKEFGYVVSLRFSDRLNIIQLIDRIFMRSFLKHIWKSGESALNSKTSNPFV